MVNYVVSLRNHDVPCRVCTDVANSMTLWEWNPSVMDSAIDMHNTAMRALLEEFGGHEIRNVRCSVVRDLRRGLLGDMRSGTCCSVVLAVMMRQVR